MMCAIDPCLSPAAFVFQSQTGRWDICEHHAPWFRSVLETLGGDFGIWSVELQWRGSIPPTKPAPSLIRQLRLPLLEA